MLLLAKGRLNFASVCSVMLTWSESGLVKEDDMIRLDINHAWMVR